MSSSLTAYDPTLSKNALSNSPKLIPFNQIQDILSRILSTEEGVHAILSSQVEAFRLASAVPSKCASLPIQTAGQIPYPPLTAGAGAQVCVKTGYAVDDTVLVSKYAAGGGKYSGNTGSVSVYDQKTLRLRAVLCDEGLLTEIRTAAAAVVASRAALLAAGTNAKIVKVGLVGGGVQAIWHLRLLAASGVVDPSKITVVVKTQTQQSAAKFIQTMKNSTYPLDQRFTIEAHNDDNRFKGCQIIHTVTPSRSPVLHLEDIDLPNGGQNSFLHISAIGSDSPGKCELALDVLQAADLCVVDSLLQTKERGEFQPSRWESMKGDAPIFSLCEIGSSIDESTGTFVVNHNRDEFGGTSDVGLFSIFDSSGMAIQDVQMAKIIVEQLQKELQ